MTLITELRHYVSTAPYKEEKKYNVWEKHYKNGIQYEITKIEGDHMIIKSNVGQYCVSKHYNFDKI